VSGTEGRAPRMPGLRLTLDTLESGYWCQFLEREFFNDKNDNPLVRIHSIIEMILVDRPCAPPFSRSPPLCVSLPLPPSRPQMPSRPPSPRINGHTSTLASPLQVGDTLTLGFGYPGVLHASDIPSVFLEGAAAGGYTSQLPSSS